MTVEYEEEHDWHEVAWWEAWHSYPKWAVLIAELLQVFPGTLFEEPIASAITEAKQAMAERDREIITALLVPSDPPLMRDAIPGMSSARLSQITNRAFARLAVALAHSVKPIDLSQAEGRVIFSQALDRAIKERDRPLRQCPHCGGRLP